MALKPFYNKKGHLGMTRAELLEKLNSAAPAGYEAETIAGVSDLSVTWAGGPPMDKAGEEIKAGGGSSFTATLPEAFTTWLNNEISAVETLPRYILASFKIGSTENLNIMGKYNTTSSYIRWVFKLGSSTLNADFYKNASSITITSTGSESGTTTFSMSGLDMHFTNDFILAVQSAAKP